MDPVDPIAAAIATEQRQADAGTVLDVQTSGPKLDPLAVQIRDEQRKADHTQTQLLDWRARNDEVDAGRRADVLRYTAASGMDADFVDQNLDQVKRKVDADQVDWALVAHQQPSLLKFLTEQPEHIPLVKDDTANLGGVEWAIKAPFHAFLDAVNQQRAVARQFSESLGTGDAENRKRIQELEAEFANKDYGADSFVQHGLVGAAQMIPFVVGDTLARVAGGAAVAKFTAPAGAAAGAAAGAPAAGVGAVPGGGIGGVIGGLSGAAVGQFVGSGLFNYYEAVGPLYWRLSQLKDSAGQPMDPAVARAFAQGGAVVQAGLMAGFMGKFGASLPGVKQLLAKFGTQAAEKALTEATTQQLVKTGLKRFGTHWLTGASMMGAQSALNAATEEAAKGSSGQDFQVQWGNVASAASRGFQSGLQDMWLLSAVGPGREMLSDLGRARASAESAVRLEAMTNSAEASKLLERLPESFQKAVETMKAEKGTVQNVYFPAEEWTRYWQEKKVDPGEVAAAVMGDGGKAYAEAARSKGDLVVPVEKYLKKLAKTEHASGLEQDMKLRPDELTARQLVAERKALKGRLDEQAKVRGAELDEGKKQVFDYIAEQARAAGIPKADAEANAKVVAEYSGTMALRLGLSVHEAAALGGVGQLSILGPKGEAVAQAAREKFRTFVRPEASALLEERLKTLSPENRAREYYLDPVSGLRNRLAFDATPAPEGKDQVGVITSPDVKGINDHPTAGGHDVANELLRAMGRALGEYPDAARDGTGFLVHVKDRDELEQLVAKVKAELGNDKLNVHGELGKSAPEAFTAEKALSDKLRAEKQLPERGQLSEGLDVAGLKFKDGRAAGIVPEHLVHEVSKLSDVEYGKQAYLDSVDVGGKRTATGLLTRQGWDNVPRKAHVASIDLRGLKAANDKYGKEFGNRMLLRFGEVLAHFGGSSFDAAHLSGDEFALQHDDPIALEQFVKSLKPMMASFGLRAVDLSSGAKEDVSVQFRDGIGRDYGQADRALNAGKRAEAAVGAGDLRQENRKGDLQRGGRRGSAEPQVQGAPAGRGAQRQGFGEVVAHVEGLPVTLSEEGAGGGPKRGAIEMRLGPEGRPVAFNIRALEADRSTLAHETAHFLSWSLHDIATSDLATKDLTRDYDTLIKWAGYGSAEERLVQTKELSQLGRVEKPTAEQQARIKTLSAKEERISHGWEQYLLEGKAPSRALERTFSRFKDWLVRIYKGVAGVQGQYREKYGESIALSDDVRGVFDRLLAQDEALRQAQADTGAAAVPPPLVTAAMTPAEREQYRQALVDAKASADSELAQRTAELENNKVQEARARATVEVTQELDKQPVYRAMRYLQDGELVDEGGQKLERVPSPLLDGDEQPYKLNRKAFVEQHGAEVARLMPQGVFARTKKGGVDVEQLAPLLGFDDGGALVDALRKAEPRQRAIQNQVQDRMDAAYGPALQRIADAAMAAVHNPDAARATLLEIRAIAKQVDPAVSARAKSIELATLKASAERLVQETPLDALDPDKFARVERTTALKAAELWGAGKKEQALEQLEARLFNQLLFTAARDAKNRAEKARDRLEAESDALDQRLEKVVNEAKERQARADKATEARMDKAVRDATEQQQKATDALDQRMEKAVADAEEKLGKVHDRLDATSEAMRGRMGLVAGPGGAPETVFRDVHDQLLAAVGLREKPAGTLKTLDQLLTHADERALDVDFDVDAIRALLANPKPWDALTVDEAEAVDRAAKNIRHIAGAELDLQLKEKKETREAWFTDFIGHLKDRTPLPAEPLDSAAKTLWQRAKGLGRGADAMLTDVPETYAHLLDGGDRAGPMHRLLIDARLACREVATRLQKEVLRRIVEKWEDVPKDIRKLGDRRVDVAELLPVPPSAEGRFAPVYTRGTLWMLFLNWGNEGNRQRIRDGMGWSDDNVGKAISLLTPPELKYLQGVLDTVNSLWPDVAGVYEKRTGLQLGKVEASPLTINGETYAGGYFPLRYRSELSRQGEVQDGELVKSLFGPNYVRPVTARGFTKERAKRVAAAVDLSWGVVPAHLSQVIHDVAYGDWVRQVGTVMMDQRFKDLTALHLGQERSSQFVPWLRDVANARADSAAAGSADLTDKLGAFARNRAAIAVMGFNLPAILPQILDPWNSAQENVPARHIATAYVKMNAHLAGLVDLPELQLSKELPFRDAMLKDNLRANLAKMGPTGQGVGHLVSETAFALYELSDRYTSRVTWKAAFDHAQSDGLADAEAATRADDVVRRSYASHDIAEKPPIMRSKRGLAGMVMFYSFANRLYNSLRRSVSDVSGVFGDAEADAGDKTKAVAQLAAKLMIMGATGAAFAYMAGRGPKKDEDVTKWLAWKAALEPFNTVPFVGPAIEGLVRKGKVDMRTSPELALMQDSVNRVADLVHKNDNAAVIAAEALLGIAGAVVGLPAGQLGRTGGYAKDVATGQERPRNALDVASGLYYGKQKNPSRNPLSDLADVVGR